MFEAVCYTLTICVTLSTYYMLDTVLNARDIVIAVNKIDKVPVLMELILKWGRQVINKYVTSQAVKKC